MNTTTCATSYQVPEFGKRIPKDLPEKTSKAFGILERLFHSSAPNGIRRRGFDLKSYTLSFKVPGWIEPDSFEEEVIVKNLKGTISHGNIISIPFSAL